MSKLAKFFVFGVLVLFVIGTSTVFYFFREQEIDTTLIPNEFRYCGKQIWGNNPEYIKIVAWLRENNGGWTPSFASYTQDHFFDGKHFIVNVLDEMVVVSYKTDHGFPQFTKSGEHGLDKQCE